MGTWTLIVGGPGDRWSMRSTQLFPLVVWRVVDGGRWVRKWCVWAHLCSCLPCRLVVLSHAVWREFRSPTRTPGPRRHLSAIARNLMKSSGGVAGATYHPIMGVPTIVPWTIWKYASECELMWRYGTSSWCRIATPPALLCFPSAVFAVQFMAFQSSVSSICRPGLGDAY